jgi:hypothetical protein
MSEEKQEKPKTISVFATEYYETSIFREAIEINVEDYPELDGMTREEAIDYIESNAWEMKSTNEEMYESMGEQLMDMDIRRDKITNESQDINAK